MSVPTQRPAPAAPPVRMATSFWVEVSGVLLPSFSELSGLSARYDVEPWEEGGQNGFVHQLPGRLTYTPISLTRQVDGASRGLAAWFTSVADTGTTFRTATIKAVDAAARVLATWQLREVFPSSWTGPSFQAGSGGALTESLELTHHGFTFTWSGQ